MKRLIRILCSGLLVLSGTVATAENFSPVGSVNRLVFESQELVQTVRYVGLNPHIQQGVQRFHFDVLRLADCSRFNGDFGVPYQCQGVFDMAKRSFMWVEQYLNNTYYEFPPVYRAYWQTREALLSLRVIGFPGSTPIPGPSPVPQPNQFTCVAVDAGWEEHAGGHLGYGRNVVQAQRMALNQCQRFHGRCQIRHCR